MSNDTENLVSGMILEGTGRASELAERITTMSFNRSGHCGIVIANESGHCLSQPHRFVYSGHVGTLPLRLPDNHSGLITAAKTFGSPWGTSGVVSYDIEGANYIRLQIMWQAPFYTTGDAIKVNVAIGNLHANEDVFDSMVNNYHGELIRARNTAHVYRLNDEFVAEVYMGDTGPSPLTVIFKKRELSRTPSLRQE